ncbi:MAG: DUF2339 domain-containing protein [Clostridiales Family XIII bacterium]|jgi:uncharacterized membrane protein|nr:DUF2339 domain-containing protein [Clostridiales Family XIII bacterium]
MGTADNLKSIIRRQKEILSELESERQAIEGSDLAKENAALKAELEKLRADFTRARDGAAILADENLGLKNALYEQIYNEKIKIVNTTAQKLDIYFRANTDSELNRLTALENGVKARIDNIRAILAQNNVDIHDDIYTKLNDLSALLNMKVTEARAKAARISGAFSRAEHDELEALKNERLTDGQIRAAAKKNNLERFVGLNVLNAVGIFLLIVGATTLARFTYVLLSDTLKGIMLFALGGLMLAAGEMMNRKKPNIFSLGISAGGVGILYAALATSYFGLHILGMYAAISVCILITAVAFILSIRYNSQTIAAFALIGGYLPMFSIGTDAVVAYGAMLYFIALNLLALLISFSKKWRVPTFIGLALNILGTFYISYDFWESTGTMEGAANILYVLFAFLIYTAIPIISTYRTKAKFRKSDIVLLAVNTVFSSLIMYGVFYSFGLMDYTGLLAVAFAVIYLFLGRAIEAKFAGEEGLVSALFYLTGLAFVVLIVPLQFGQAWLSLGWLAEGVFLAAYGVLGNEKRFRQVGFAISLLCLGAFIIFDCMYIRDYLFVYKYLAITLGSLLILGAYMYRKMMAGRFVEIYKYFALANVWIFAMYFILVKMWGFLLANSGPEAYRIDYLLGAAAVTATFALAYLFPRIRLLSDMGVKILSISLYAIGILGLFVLNTSLTPVARVYLQPGTPGFGVTIAGTAILLVLGLLSVLALRDMMKMIVVERKMGIEWYPLIISGYFVVVLTQNLIVQFNLSFSSAAISIIYVLTALAWIVFGFARRYSFIRKFGLGLAILSVIKLFLIDLASLTQGFRIISYFVLGVILIAISFVYQYFNKRLELKEGVPADAEKGD